MQVIVFLVLLRENIAIGPPSLLGGPVAVSMWALEEANYDYDTNTCIGICGHYTQVVWPASTDLGCGAAVCDSFGLIVVCDYSPGGNTGGRPYQHRFW